VVGGARIVNAAGLEAVAQHAFAAGDPAAAGSGEVPTNSVEIAPSAGHMPAGAAPKCRAWLACARVDVRLDAAAPARVGGGEGQRRVGHGFPRNAEVEQQRRQRMRLRRRGQLDLAALGQRAPARDQPLINSPMLASSWRRSSAT
jgi:hypothetical protein